MNLTPPNITRAGAEATPVTSATPSPTATASDSQIPANSAQQQQIASLRQKYGIPPGGFPQATAGANADIAKNLASAYAAKNTPVQPHEDLLSKVGDTVNKFLPGKQIGESLVDAGTNIKNLVTGGISGFEKGLPDNTVNVPKLIGDYGSAGLTVGLAGAGGGETALGRVGLSSAIGGAFGGTSALANGENIAKGTAEGVAGGAALGVGGEALGAVAPKVGEAFNSLRDKLNEPAAAPAVVDSKIVNDFTKAIKPSVAGKNTSTQVDAYNKNVVNGVRAIVQNKDSLALPDELGTPHARLPENIQELSQAINQTKSSIFDKYNQLAVQAGQKGADVQLSPIAEQLTKVASDPVVKDLHPDLAAYAQQRADALTARGSYDLPSAQKAVANLNQSLDAYYRNPSYETASKASIDSLIANHLRTGLDDAVSSMDTEGNSQYSALKQQYGSLKAIEKDVAKRGVVDARQTGGRGLNVGDIVSAEELIRGLSTMNPGTMATGVAIKAAQAARRWYTDPNRAIKGLFVALDKEAQNPSISSNIDKIQPIASPSGIASNSESNPISQSIPTTENAVNTPPVDNSAITTPTPVTTPTPQRGFVNGKVVSALAGGGALAAGVSGGGKKVADYLNGIDKSALSNIDAQQSQQNANTTENKDPNFVFPADAASDKPANKAQVTQVKQAVSNGEIIQPSAHLAPVIDSTAQATGTDPAVLKAILMMESSMAYDDSSKNPKLGKYAWIAGLTNSAKADLKKAGIEADYNTREGALTAAADFYNLLQKRYPKASPEDIYFDHYYGGPEKTSGRRALFQKALSTYGL